MNDDVKAAVEKLREAFEFDRKRDNDTAESLWRDELLILAHIDGEPARIAAACEEVREAVARHVMGPALKRDPDLFADHLEEVYAATIRRMPLTATPLGDALRLANETVVKLAQAATEAQARADEGVRYWTDLAQAEARDAAALRASVAALERERDMLQTALRDNSAAHSETGKMLLRVEAERDALRARVFEVEQRQVGYVLVSFASHEQWKAELAELSALRARVDELKLALGAERDRHDADGKALMQARAQVEAARTYARQALDYGEDCDATDLLAAMDEAKP